MVYKNDPCYLWVKSRLYAGYNIVHTSGFDFDNAAPEQLVCIPHELRESKSEEFFGMGIAVDFYDITASRPGACRHWL